MKKSFLLLCLLCAPMAINAGDGSGVVDNGAGVVPLAQPMAIDVPLQPAPSVGLSFNITNKDEAVAFAKALQNIFPDKNEGFSCQKALLNLGIDVAKEIRTGLILATAGIIMFYINKRYYFDPMNNEDRQTKAQATNTGRKDCVHWQKRIKELLDRKEKSELTDKEQLILDLAQEKYSDLELAYLRSSMDENKKSLNKTLEHKGAAFVNVVLPALKS